MSEYTAAMIGVMGVLAYFVSMAFLLNEKHDALKLFLLLGSAVMAWASINFANWIISATTPSAGLSSAIGYVYTITIWVGGLTLIYFVLYFLFGTMRRVVDKKEGKGGMGL